MAFGPAHSNKYKKTLLPLSINFSLSLWGLSRVRPLALSLALDLAPGPSPPLPLPPEAPVLAALAHLLPRKGTFTVPRFRI